MKPYKIIISGGGTGGHIFPALSIAGELKQRFPDADVLFVGATGRMEMERVPAAGFPITGLPVMGFPRKPGFAYLRFAWNLIRSMAMARRIVRQFKPDLAIGVGGYASGPLLRAASAFKVPTLIQEQNSYAGLTNKLLGKKASAICVAYEGMERFFPKEKLIVTGNPVRPSLLKLTISKEEALAHYGLSNFTRVVLITGGSLGARTINNAMLRNLDSLGSMDVAFIWQTGSYYFEEMSEKTRETLPGNVQIHKFLNNMDAAYMASDVVISRAGASTLSELCLASLPAILVPSPNVAEDHQTRNAEALTQKSAAILISDQNLEKELVPVLTRLLANQDQLKQLSLNIRQLAKPNATSDIVDVALTLLKR